MVSTVCRIARVVVLLAAIQVAILASGYVLGIDGFFLNRPAFAQNAPGNAWRGPKSVAPVAEPLIAAVVNISTTQIDHGAQGVPLPRVPEGSPFEEFFEEFFDRRGEGPVPQRKVSSLGSGFVIDGKQGLVVTNNHVIADADEIVVNFHDGTKLKVDKVVGTDAKTDIAVLKVTPKKPLVDVRFGRSAVMRVGDWVMAIGNPFGLGGSVTVGIISAKQRDIQSGPYDEYLQTDAAINKGNSGGPLFNMDGEVIGINTAIISPTGGSIGIGFAVPSDTAVSVIEQLRTHGEVRRGWLGVKIQSVGEEIAESLGVPPNTGALVSTVEPSGPADKAGIRAGDVIVMFNDEKVAHMRSLPRIVARTPVGQPANVTVLRKGVSMSFKVTIGHLREETNAPSVEISKLDLGNDRAGDLITVLGMKLAPLDDKLRERYRLDGKVDGVVVVSIDPASEAAKRDIAVGDVIAEAGQKPVRGPEDVVKSLERVRKAGRTAMLLRIEDAGGELRFVAIPLP